VRDSAAFRRYRVDMGDGRVTCSRKLYPSWIRSNYPRPLHHVTEGVGHLHMD
jgi:hypothetical protein